MCFLWPVPHLSDEFFGPAVTPSNLVRVDAPVLPQHYGPRRVGGLRYRKRNLDSIRHSSTIGLPAILDLYEPTLRAMATMDSPFGLVDVFEKSEIVDLLSFLETGGFQVPEHLDEICKPK